MGENDLRGQLRKQDEETYKVLLVGERHEYASKLPYSAGAEAYSMEMEKETDLIREFEPDYLLVENDEKHIEDYNRVEKLARRYGVKVLPIEEPTSRGTALTHITKRYENEKLLAEIYLLDAYRTGWISREEANAILRDSPYLQRVLGFAAISDVNSDRAKAAMKDKLYPLYERTANQYEALKEQGEHIYFYNREKYWAHNLAKLRMAQPHAKLMAILGREHVNGSYTTLPRLLREEGIKYKAHVVSEDIEKIESRNAQEKGQPSSIEENIALERERLRSTKEYLEYRKKGMNEVG